VAENVESIRGIDGDALDVCTLGEDLVKVLEYTIDTGYNDVAALEEEFRAGSPFRHLGLFAIDDEGDLLGI
jgi:hypothetical protein